MVILSNLDIESCRISSSRSHTKILMQLFLRKTSSSLREEVGEMAKPSLHFWRFLCGYRNMYYATLTCKKRLIETEMMFEKVNSSSCSISPLQACALLAEVSSFWRCL